MQREQLSNTVSLALHGADRSTTQLPGDDSVPDQLCISAFADEPHASMGTAFPSGREMGKLLSSFKSAAEDQAAAYRDLSERVARLERNEEATSLRETVRDLHKVLSGLAGEMDRRISQTEYRIAAVLQTVESLEANIASASNGLKRLNLSAQDKIVTLHELVNSAAVRVDHVETAMAELKGGDGKIFTAIDALSQNLDFLDDKLSKEQKETAQLSDRFRLAEHQIAGLADCEAKLGDLSKRVSELRQMEKSLRELQGQSDQASADICTLSEDIRVLQGGVGSVNTEYRQLKDRIEQAETGIAASLEQSQSLARLHARLAETFLSKTG